MENRTASQPWETNPVIDRKKAIRVVLFFDGDVHVDDVLGYIDFKIGFPENLKFLGYDYADPGAELPTEGPVWE